ncbi:MAG: ABC transporter permease [Firmicutes bacterium]|nr:ABC transporter permease [Bacillota bacterium]MCD7788066.1 ABC transporter permease [Bacillota bacterium]MCD7831711.1 ABC transporter permease [Bacillota bacterium]MCD8311772.1 ABC transporter permease [Bacillota bacterium]MCD8314504.1 ABC transporter permease [Bacillota bacterium]
MKTASKIYLALVFIFLYAPIAVMILISFNSSDSTTQFAGFSLRWYREMLNDKNTLEALKNTLVLSFCAAVLSTLIGTAAAIGIDGMKRRWVKGAVMSVTNIPMMNPDIVTGISLMLLFVFAGSVTGVVSFGFATLLIAHVTFDLPYVVLSVLPKLKQMDKNLPEAATDLGCTPLQSFFKVELPLIAPGIITGFIMAFTLSFDDFVISNFTSGSSYETLTIHIYSMIKKSVKPDVYALSTVIFLVILVLLVFYNFSESSDERAARKKRDADKRRSKELRRLRGETKKSKS